MLQHGCFNRCLQGYCCVCKNVDYESGQSLCSGAKRSLPGAEPGRFVWPLWILSLGSCRFSCWGRTDRRFFDKRGDSLWVRDVDGVASLGFDNLGTRVLARLWFVKILSEGA